jgi:ornithine cyclodeaminase/alanine dehydrogenase-like protein (mu-crystallin family)
MASIRILSTDRAKALVAEMAGQDPIPVTLFKSVGNAVQDIAAATRALRMAQERGLGTIVEL